jgi:predicted nucleic acid-binding protein
VTILADTGALYALIDASDVWHRRVTTWWGAAPRDVAVPVTVLPEVTYLLATRIGAAAETAFVRAIADDEFTIESLERGDVDRAAALMAQYGDFPLGFVDATIVAMAERLGTRDVLTTDRRHFGTVRPRHARHLTLLP